jgi:hypothetical protein
MSLPDNHAKVVNLGLLKVAFFGFQVQFIFTENLQDFTDGFSVVFKGVREDENIVHVNHNFASKNEVFQESVHCGLEHCKGVGQTKEHN